QAILLSMAAVSAYFLIVAYAQAIGFGLDGGAWASSPAPLYKLAAADAFGSKFLAQMIEALVILDLAAIGLGGMVATTRGLFAMGRDRRIPAVFARVDRRYGTPTVAIAFVVLVSAALILLTRLTGGLLSRATSDAAVMLRESMPLFRRQAGL